MQLNTARSLADLLSQNSNVLIKSYGLSGLSTVSLRGGNANHTAVLWNGFNLQDPLNGGFNFALAPVNLVDAIKIKYGGSSAIYGSGALSGTIQLDNLPMFGKGFIASVDYHLGSYAKQQIAVKAGYGTKKWYTSLKFFDNKTDNDFTYTNTAKIEKPIDTLHNASMKQQGFLFESYYSFSNYQTISTQLWVQDNFREIPPNMVSSGSNFATQKDRWQRLALNWHKKGKTLDWQARTGFFGSYLNYVKNDIMLNATHKSFNNIIELLADYKGMKKTMLSLGLNNSFTTAISDNFSGKPKLDKAALFFSVKLKLLKNTVININTRAEIVNKLLKPLTYGFFAEYKFANYFFVSTNLSKNHHNPNFNDLYWGGAWAKGNPDLQDENGYTADIGLATKYANNRWSVKSKLSVYQNNINQMIQWVPLADYWTPINQKRVRSMGLEYTFKSKIRLTENTDIGFISNYSYTRALIKEVAENESPDILNKQLVYTPYHQANAMISCDFRNFSVQTNINYNGKQYTRADNKAELDAYWLVDVSANYKFDIKRLAFMLFAKANNIFNTEYMVREWYPMPKINYEAGMKLGLGNK